MNALVARVLSNTSRFELPLLCVVLMFVSFHLYGVAVVDIGRLSIAPWDWASVIVFILSVLGFGRRRVVVRHSAMAPLLFAGLFTLWVGIRAFASPEPERGFTLVLMQLRNAVLFFMITIMLSSFQRTAVLNRLLFGVGVVISILALCLYVPALGRLNEIAASPGLWKPGVGYLLDQGRALRLIGFSRDPNFYSIWMSVSLFAGFALSNPWRWVGMGVIGISLALAMSRSFFLIFPLSTLLLVAIVMRKSSLRATRPYFSSILIGLAVTSAATITGVIFAHINLLEMLAKRVELAGRTPRFSMWASLLQSDFNRVIGEGLRATEIALGGMYSHNGYLDVLYETGGIGLLLWVSFLAAVTVTGVSKLRNVDWAPWVHAWLLSVGILLSFSLTYHPFVWTLAGVVVGVPLFTGNESASRRAWDTPEITGTRY